MPVPSPQQPTRLPPTLKMPQAGASLTGLLAVAQGVPRGEALALLRVDQWKRWQRGERVPLEAYLEQLPALRGQDDVFLDLVAGEVLLRKSLGESPSEEEYRQRFPDTPHLLRRVFG